MYTLPNNSPKVRKKILKTSLALLGLVLGTPIVILWIFLTFRNPVADDWYSIVTPDDALFVSDVTFLDDQMFFVFSQHSRIYKLQNDSLISICGELGFGALKFKSPERIKPYKHQLVIGDLKNAQLQMIDSIGTFAGSFPKRQVDDFHWDSGPLKNLHLHDFFVSDQCVGIVYSDKDRGGNEFSKIVLYREPERKPSDSDIPVSYLGAIEYDSDNGTLYIQSYNNISAYNLNGELLSGIGIYRSNRYEFGMIADIRFYNNRLYVLQKRIDESSRETTADNILILNQSLSIVDSLSFEATYYYPQCIDVCDNGKTIVVVNSGGDRLLRLDNPVYAYQ